jgi:hypothetical protein
MHITSAVGFDIIHSFVTCSDTKFYIRSFSSVSVGII